MKRESGFSIRYGGSNNFRKVLLMVTTVFGAAGAANAANYSFNVVAQTGTDGAVGGKIMTSFFSLDINDSGTIAFLAAFPGGAGGVLTQSALLAQMGDTIGGQTLT